MTPLDSRVETEIREMRRVGMMSEERMEAALTLLRAEADLDAAYPGAKVSEIAELLLERASVL